MVRIHNTAPNHVHAIAAPPNHTTHVQEAAKIGVSLEGVTIVDINDVEKVDRCDPERYTA